MNQFFLGINDYRLNHSFSYLKKKTKKMVHDYQRYILLKKIMKEETLSTYFQPILDLKTGGNFGYEVLNRPPSSHLFPTTDHFYHFIGQTDQVFQFERYSRNLSLKRFYNKMGGNVSQNDNILFINIHPQVLIDSNYKRGETIQLLEEIGISPNQVVFELTEKQTITDFELFKKVLHNYRFQGFRIAIDDVGSGYNSLKTLVHMKPEFIKLDKSLIQHIDVDTTQQELLSLLLEFANKSGTFVIAEGIETKEELAILRQHKVHFGQGYALGKPNKEVIPGSLPIFK